jgi:hypothetical protein
MSSSSGRFRRQWRGGWGWHRRRWGTGSWSARFFSGWIAWADGHHIKASADGIKQIRRTESTRVRQPLQVQQRTRLAAMTSGQRAARRGRGLRSGQAGRRGWRGGRLRRGDGRREWI